MLVLAVTWMANENYVEEVAETFRKLQAAARQEPGCLMFIVHRHIQDPSRFFVYEQYSDQAALDTHRSSPHFQHYARTDLPKLASRLEGELYTPLTAD